MSNKTFKQELIALTAVQEWANKYAKYNFTDSNGVTFRFGLALARLRLL